LHWIAILSGIVFLGSSLFYSRLTDGTAHVFAGRHVLLCLMLALTLVSQFGIISRMDVLRASLGEVRSVPIDNPERVQFDALHVWSTRVEGAVLLLGLVVVYLTARSF
jgi:Zn-dependent protease with chaperone function